MVCALLLAATVLAPAASAQYVKPPGNGPNVGSTDNGVVSTDAPGDVTPPGGTTGPPTEVKGKQFARDISASNSGFQLYWLWLLMALGLGLAFLILWRRRREEEEDDFSGAQPA
ncbi:MAG: hypothetical protein QOE35_650 [Actinomycetota bacterium]